MSYPNWQHDCCNSQTLRAYGEHRRLAEVSSNRTYYHVACGNLFPYLIEFSRIRNDVCISDSISSFCS